MKAFVIDPFKQEITEAEYSGNYEQIYELGDFGTFDAVGLNSEGDVIYVDDNGLYKENQRYFQIGEGQLAGKGVVLGTNRRGESVAPKVTLAHLKSIVTWLPEGFSKEPFMTFIPLP